MSTDLSVTDRLDELTNQFQGMAGLITQISQRLDVMTTPAPGAANPPVSLPAPVFPVHSVQQRPKMLLPDRFDGNPDRYRTFRESCRLYFRFNVFPSEAEKVAVVVSLLQGPPQDWALALPSDATEWISVDRFFLALGQVYDDPDRAALAETHLLSIQQGRRSAEDYCSEFRQWCSVTGWPDQPLKTLFRQGLSDAVKDAMVSHPIPESLSDFMALAVTIDRRLRERRREKQGGSTVQFRPGFSVKPPSTFSKKMPVQSPSSYPSQSSGEEPMLLGSTAAATRRRHRLENALCLYCGKSGHFLRDCPSKPKSPLGNASA